MKSIRQKLSSLKRKLRPPVNSFLPPLALDYNSGARTLQETEETFKKASRKVIPFLIRRFNPQQADNPAAEIRLLDIGCGFSPIAYGLRHLSDVSATKFQYTGLDIRKDAIDWCRNAYRQYGNFEFIYHEASASVDYIGKGALRSKTELESKGAEGKYALKKIYNLQWSSSVFTHMTKNAIVNALTQVREHVESGSIQANTWLLVDEFSAFSMRVGIADRQLPIDTGDFFTYSAKNPLVCSAYKIEVMREIYRLAGLEIVEILRGSWRGTDDNGVCYQDVVVSRKPH